MQCRVDGVKIWIVRGRSVVDGVKIWIVKVLKPGSCSPFCVLVLCMTGNIKRV